MRVYHNGVKKRLALLLALAVLLAAATVLRCKPKDILSQME